MSLSGGYTERHKPEISTGIVRVIEGPDKTTAFVRENNVPGVGTGKTRQQAIDNAFNNVGVTNGVNK